MKKLRCIALLTFVALSTTLHAQTNAAANAQVKQATGDVLAKAKNFVVKESEVADAFIDYKANLAATRKQTIPEDQRAMVESNLLDRIIVTKVLTGRATDEDKAKAKESTEKLIANARKQFPTDEAFERQLQATGMSPDQFHSRAYEQTLCETVVERELKSKIKITDEEAKKFYDENPARFERPENVRAAHVLISTVEKDTQKPVPDNVKKEKEKLAKEVKARAEKGEDFAKLVKEYSDDPGSKDKGGEYTFARGEMVPEFEAAAFSLKTNQISDVVETRYGYHIIKLLQKIPAEKIAFEKVLPDLKEGLAQQEAQKKVPDYFAKIKKEAGVEIVGESKDKP
jgi:peptidyl-prolyl cis-trans isomerase C